MRVDSPQPKIADPVCDRLAELIESRRARIGVIGLGYVGLPLAANLAQAGFTVTGYDIDEKRIQALTAGEHHIVGNEADWIQEALDNSRLTTTTDRSALADTEVIIICVPTPLTKTKTPDMSYVEAAAAGTAECLRPGRLVILESTTYPGTTEETILPVLESSGLNVGRDFYLCFSPERIDPGNDRYSIWNTPKIVGGVTPACTHLATKLYSAVSKDVVEVSSAKVAESAKLFENVFRNVNIALVNELLVLCNKMGISVWEVIDAAATKPFGFMRFNPGPGVGGHCIPVDPYYLSAKAKEYDMHSHFIEFAGEVNDNMPAYVVKRLTEALNERGRALKGSRILILGVGYKRDIGDTRGSPALKIIRDLAGKGAQVSYNDPFVPMLEDMGLSSEALSEKMLAKQDVVVLTCDHSDYDPDWLVSSSRLIFDTRNAIKFDGHSDGSVIKL